MPDPNSTNLYQTSGFSPPADNDQVPSAPKARPSRSSRKRGRPPAALDRVRKVLLTARTLVPGGFVAISDEMGAAAAGLTGLRPAQQWYKSITKLIERRELVALVPAHSVPQSLRAARWQVLREQHPRMNTEDLRDLRDAIGEDPERRHALDREARRRRGQRRQRRVGIYGLLPRLEFWPTPKELLGSSIERSKMERSTDGKMKEHKVPLGVGQKSTPVERQARFQINQRWSILVREVLRQLNAVLGHELPARTGRTRLYRSQAYKLAQRLEEHSVEHILAVVRFRSTEELHFNPTLLQILGIGGSSNGYDSGGLFMQPDVLAVAQADRVADARRKESRRRTAEEGVFRKNVSKHILTEDAHALVG